MSAFDDVWSGSALRGLAALDGRVRDVVEALVRDVCDGPLAFPLEGGGRVRVAWSGGVRVLFQVDELEQLVYVVDVTLRG